jgi:hypothetical protein
MIPLSAHLSRDFVLFYGVQDAVKQSSNALIASGALGRLVQCLAIYQVLKCAAPRQRSSTELLFADLVPAYIITMERGHAGW